MLNYVLGPLVDDPDLQEEYYDQTTLADVADMQQQEGVVCVVDQSVR